MTRTGFIGFIAAYHFTPIDAPEAFASTLRARAEALSLRGSVLVAGEGLNLFLAGDAGAIESFLAARFAAKEAFGKAVGTGLSGITLKNILVWNNHNGKPCIELYGNALEALRAVGGVTVHVSLTHERDNALAMVVIEGESHGE